MTTYGFFLHCQVLADKDAEVDQLLRKKTQALSDLPGVDNVRVYSDLLIGWSERTVLVEVEDRSNFSAFLTSREREDLQSALARLTVNIQTDIGKRSLITFPCEPDSRRRGSSAPLIAPLALG
jgi:hypothetical protein